MSAQLPYFLIISRTFGHGPRSAVVLHHRHERPHGSLRLSALFIPVILFREFFDPVPVYLWWWKKFLLRVVLYLTAV